MEADEDNDSICGGGDSASAGGTSKSDVTAREASEQQQSDCSTTSALNGDDHDDDDDDTIVMSFQPCRSRNKASSTSTLDDEQTNIDCLQLQSKGRAVSESDAPKVIKSILKKSDRPKKTLGFAS